jgi:hypothetical protein
MFIFKLTQPFTYFYSSVTVNLKEKGGKPDRKLYPLHCGLRNLKSENSQNYAQKPQQNWTFMNSASGEAGQRVGKAVKRIPIAT